MHRVLRPLTLIGLVLALLTGACMPPEEILEDDLGEDLYDRPEDAELENDRERVLGDPADVHGLQATVVAAEFVPQLSETETAGYLVAEVKLENLDRGETPYDRLDWVLEFPDGSTKNRIAAASQPDQIESDDLASDASVEGKVYFQIGSERGEFYVLYAPRRAAQMNDNEKERGVWKVTIEEETAE